MKYKDELIRSMKWLGEKDNTLFLGEATAFSGHAISGTLTEVPKDKLIEFYLSNETLKRSKFKSIEIGDYINLELPVKKSQKISGHICQGHVDTTAKIIKISKKDKSIIYDFNIKNIFKKQLVTKASILINGVSLTISDITKNGFKIWAIPHTLKSTNLSKLKKGNIVNVEIDILSKYVKKYFNEKK